ncbi:MAG: ABC transporter permease, partial [Bacteroidia bacterium]
SRISKLFSGATGAPDTTKIQLKLFFDPVTKESFKASISGALDRIVSGIEMQSMGQVLMKQLAEAFPDSKPAPFEAKPLVTTVQEYATTSATTLVPNAVQHNVPAWTMFAMFFICIPLSGNIIREREDGSAFRLLTMPGSYIYVLLGKVLLYLMVSLLQFALMLFVGIYILPLAGVEKLQIGNALFTLFVVALSAGLAATGFGLLVGTVANSQDQAALFGAVCVVILAALGGVWIPTFVMTDTMKTISGISPLNWGLEAFYGVFLRGLSLGGIVVHVAKLIVFCMACVGGAWYYQVKRRMA